MARSRAVAPGLPVAADGVEPAVGELGLARQRLRLGAHLGKLRALAFDLGADVGELAFQVRRRRQFGQARFRRCSRRPAPRRGRRSAGSWPRSGPKCAPCCAPFRARPWRAVRARCRPRAARCANARGRRLRPRRLRSAPIARPRRPCACRRASCARRRVRASMSERRLRCARRRAAPVGACASAAKPSQRQRSPSRETRRWPGLSRHASRAPSARSTTPIWARRRDSSGGACTNWASDCAPSGSAGSDGSIAAPIQRMAWLWSTGASRSSPSAAPSAIS